MTSAPILFSSVGVNSFNAKEVGQIAPRQARAKERTARGFGSLDRAPARGEEFGPQLTAFLRFAESLKSQP
jgi:hypothetical protein